MDLRMNIMYFSPTGTTKKIVSGIATKIEEFSHKLKVINTIDFTLPSGRKKRVCFGKDDLVIIGLPVYAGRLPNILLKYLDSIKGEGAIAVAIVVYGNRNYDDALVELADILKLHNFYVIAGGAFIGEHAFSKTLGKNRPDEKDMGVVSDFASQIYGKLKTKDIFRAINLKGDKPYRQYYTPRDENGNPIKDFRKIKPKTNKVDCIDCKLCAEVCPMGSISFSDTAEIIGICIKCGACIKKCPQGAKYFDDPGYLGHKRALEMTFNRRAEPEIFI